MSVFQSVTMLSRILKMDENSPRLSEKEASPSPITGIVRGLKKSTLSSEHSLQCYKNENETEEIRHTKEGKQHILGTQLL